MEVVKIYEGTVHRLEHDHLREIDITEMTVIIPGNNFYKHFYFTYSL